MSQQIEKETQVTVDGSVRFAQKALRFHRQADRLNAIKYAKLAVECAPDNDRHWHLLGVIYQHQGNNEAAANYFTQAIAINDQEFIYHYNLGKTLKMLGETEKSLTAYQCGLKYSANDIPSLNEIGLLFTELKKFDEAEAAFLKAFSLNENNASTCINVSHLYVEKKEVRKAIDFANKALTLEPYRSEPYCNIGTAFIIGNQIPEGIEYLKLSLSLTNKSTKTALTHQSILMNMLYADCYSPEEIFLEHKNWANTHLIQKSTFDNKAGLTFNKHKILNIGFVSSDFNDHSIAQFLTPVMENINQDKFKIHCYSTTEKIDQITKIYKQFATKWHDIANIDEHEIDNIIRQDKIDILIDLSGHSLGSNISIFANKPAPIQITYLGYPFSSGLKNMDYRITDYFTDPENITEHLHSEKLARISPSFLCYKPKAAPIINKTLPRERNSYLTFGSFNNFYKLSNDTISAWAKILINTPQSVIFLKSTLPIPDGLKDTILSRFEENGIHFSRIKMHHATIKKTEHLDMYNNIDICLDPFPYNGTTTTYEAISMGVPVVALSGDCHHSRVSSGILNNLGLTELTAESTETYISLATNLAKNTDKLKHYRKNLRPLLFSSPLTDAVAFSKKFEHLLENAWNTCCDKEQKSRPV